MLGRQRFRELISAASKGSIDAIAELSLFAGDDDCSPCQYLRITSVLYSHLNISKAHRFKSGQTSPFCSVTIHALCLRTLGATLPVWLLCEEIANKLIRDLASHWRALHQWVILLYDKCIDQENYDYCCRLLAKRAMIDFLGLCRLDELADWTINALKSTDVPRVVFGLWYLEIRDPRFSPWKEDDESSALHRSAAILDAALTFFIGREPSGTLDWENVFIPFGGDKTVLASTALQHLEIDRSQPVIDFEVVAWDIHLLTTLCARRPTALALLSQQSIEVAVDVLSYMGSQPLDHPQQTYVAACIANCWWYISFQLEAGDGVPWITQALEAHLLPALIKCETWFPHLQDDFAREPLSDILAGILPKYTVYGSVLRAAGNSLADIDDLGLEDHLRKDGEFWEAWSTFRNVAEARLELLDNADRDERHTQTCHNDKCSKAGASGSFKRCIGCKHVYYCSKECQRFDWKYGSHKSYCRVIQGRQSDGTISTVRMRDLRFLDRLVEDELARASSGIAEGLSTHDLDYCVVEMDYTCTPPKFSLGVDGALPIPQTCPCDEPMVLKWEHMLDLAEKASEPLVLVRAFLPGGIARRVLLQILPFRRIYPLDGVETDSDCDSDESGLNGENPRTSDPNDYFFSYVYTCGGHPCHGETGPDDSDDSNE
ncbi:hypothetical protein BV22DRAFT_1033845 [Leucogyrophana mollusca]|uniref:Uncharacterized protein n=1 Tax=Leucogyrophana mollusca TaxID=85980 RepID=A0ACB8BL59_9AGAM|nr:hypothetical protein BV22DRAFT_1033845 [Leucogyrophana mollusca]